MNRRGKLLLAGGVFFAFLAGCGSRHLRTEVRPEFYRTEMMRAAVMPFRVRPAASRPFGEVADPRPKAALFLTDRLRNGLAAKGRFAVVGLWRVRKALAELSPKTESPFVPFAAEDLSRVGAALGVDVLFVGDLGRWRRREGGAYGSPRPARVGFDVRLVRVRDGVVLWRAGYSESQKSLAEDLSALALFIERKGRFLSAEELAARGVERILEAFPFNKLPHAEKQPSPAARQRDSE